MAILKATIQLALVHPLSVVSHHMPETLGYHLTKTTYGTWLPGDARGSWLKEWSPKEGYGPLHRLSDADQRRELMARRQMNHGACMLTEEMIDAVVDAISDCVVRSKGGLKIMAAAIEPTHVHLLLPNTGRDIDITAKWLADQTTKMIHRRTAHSGPVGPANLGASTSTTTSTGSNCCNTSMSTTFAQVEDRGRIRSCASSMFDAVRALVRVWGEQASHLPIDSLHVERQRAQHPDHWSGLCYPYRVAQNGRITNPRTDWGGTLVAQ